MAGDADVKPADNAESSNSSGTATASPSDKAGTGTGTGSDNTTSSVAAATSAEADTRSAEEIYGQQNEGGNGWLTDVIGSWLDDAKTGSTTTVADKGSTETAARDVCVASGFPDCGIDYNKEFGDLSYQNWDDANYWSDYQFGANLNIESGGPTADDATGGALTHRYHEVAEDTADTTKPPKEGEEKPPEQNQKGWFSESFDNFFDLFGSSSGDQAAATVKASDGGEGTFKKEGDHVSGTITAKDGQTADYDVTPGHFKRHDEQGTIERDRNGMRYDGNDGKSHWENEGGTWKVVGEDGEKFYQDKDGTTHVEANGKTWTKGKDGVLRDGAGLEVKNDEITRDLEGMERKYHIAMNRHHLAAGESITDHARREHDDAQGEGEAAQHKRDTIETVTDADGKSATIRHTKDGRVTVVTHEDGSTEMIMKGRSGQEFSFKVEKGSQEIEVTLPSGQKAKMHKDAEGNWHRIGSHGGEPDADDDDDNDAVNTVKELTSRARTVTGEGAQIDLDAAGGVRVTDAQGNTQVEVNPDQTKTDNGAVTTDNTGSTQGRTTVIGANGETAAVALGENGKATLTIGDQTTTVDPSTGAYSVTEQGKEVVHSGEKAGQDVFDALPDYTLEQNGNLTAPDGTYLQNGNLYTNDGEIDPYGNMWFNDGFEMDANGNMYYDGEYFGSASDDGWGAYDTEAADSGDAAESYAYSTINSANSEVQALIAKINSGEKVDPGSLVAVYSALDGAKGLCLSAAAAGDIDAIMAIGPIDSALAEVSNGINQGNIQVATLETAQYALRDLADKGIAVGFGSTEAAELARIAPGGSVQAIETTLNNGQDPNAPGNQRRVV